MLRFSTAEYRLISVNFAVHEQGEPATVIAVLARNFCRQSRVNRSKHFLLVGYYSGNFHSMSYISMRDIWVETFVHSFSLRGKFMIHNCMMFRNTVSLFITLKWLCLTFRCRGKWALPLIVSLFHGCAYKSIFLICDDLRKDLLISTWETNFAEICHMFVCFVRKL